LVALNIPDSANANYDSFADLAWQSLGKYDQSFAFDTPRSETISIHGHELQILGADARQDGVSDNGKDSSLHAKSANDADNRSDTIYEESATSLGGHSMDHGGFGEATEADTSQNFPHGTAILSAGEDRNRGQSQRDSHASEGGSAGARQQAKNDPPGHDSNHGQSQRDLHASEDGSAAAEQHAKRDVTPENETNRGQSKGVVHAVPANAANNPHSGSSLDAGGKDQPTDDVGERAVAPAFGDSFHFKEIGASKASDGVALHVGHGPDSIEHGLHTAGHDGPASIQEADLVGLSLAEQNAVDHAKGTEHHLTHDLFV